MVQLVRLGKGEKWVRPEAKGGQEWETKIQTKTIEKSNFFPKQDYFWVEKSRFSQIKFSFETRYQNFPEFKTGKQDGVAWPLPAHHSALLRQSYFNWNRTRKLDGVTAL